MVEKLITTKWSKINLYAKWCPESSHSCSAHLNHILAVRTSLNNGFPNGWMSRDLKKLFEKGEPTPKPPRSLDLTPGLFFWGFSKNIVYADKIQNSMHLQ